MAVSKTTETRVAAACLPPIESKPIHACPEPPANLATAPATPPHPVA